MKRVLLVLAGAIALAAAACAPPPEDPGATTTTTSTTSTTSTTTTTTAPPASPTSLTGEFHSLLPPATTTGGVCNTAGDSTFTFSVAGTATGPYPGTFTETGTVTIGAQTEEFLPGQFRGPITAFSSTFTITSAAGTVQGTKSLVPATTFNIGACIDGSGVAQIQASSLTYQATITAPGGTYLDSGSTWDNFNMYPNPTANSSSLQFRSAFTSTSFGPAPTGPAPGCYEGDPGGTTNYADAQYVGPIDTVGNIFYWSSSDGSCTGTKFLKRTLVAAATQAAASTTCQGLLGVNAINYSLDTIFTGLGSTVWECFWSENV